MRLTCPHCGPRDRREFYYLGAALSLNRPDPAAAAQRWDEYLHQRENTAGVVQDLWYHEHGCAAWLRVTRDTRSHDVIKVEDVTSL